MWHWIALLAVIVLLLGADLALHRDNHEPTTRRALVESAAWVACGLGFWIVVLVLWGGPAFGEYLSGYVIEKSLSIDNVFVWAVIFSSFAIPARYQHRVLFWGIFGALAMRAVFILAGTALIDRFWWMLLLFGAVLLVFVGLKMALSHWFHVPTVASLGVIVAILAVAIVASMGDHGAREGRPGGDRGGAGRR